MGLQIPALFRNGMKDLGDAMAHFVTDKEANKQHGKKNAKERESQKEVIDLRNITLVQHILVRIMDRILEQHSGQTPGNTYDQTKQVHLLLVVQAGRYPSDKMRQ